MNRESQWYALLMERCYDGIAILDQTCQVVDVNQRFADMLGYTLEEMRGLHAWDWEANLSEAEIRSRFADVAHVNCVFETRHRRKDGTVLDVEVSASGAMVEQESLVFTIVRDVSDRKRQQRAVESEKALFETMIESLPGIFYLYDANLKLRRWNRNHETDTGFTAAEMMGRDLADWHASAESKRAAVEASKAVLRSGSLGAVESPLLCKDGSAVYYMLTGVRFDSPDGPMLMGVGVNITERKRVEMEREKLREQLLQAQKMESVGRLAGGVAHDFNNMLQTILGNVELTLDTPGLADQVRDSLLEIRSAAEHSADLTRQLLAFARKQTAAPRVLCLNDTVQGTLKMLSRLIGEDIDLAWRPCEELWRVRVDPGQIDQILANLCVNARDAIGGAGKITIEVGNVSVDNDYSASHVDFIPGAYVMLAVSDDGCGMERAVLEHIFEPFFTTKGMGQGTGLGLATVYGIVKQNNGFINVYSEPDKGTTFKIYFPRYEGDAAITVSDAPGEPTRAQGETVLLVEDERSVLNLGRRLLEQLGYAVIASNHPRDALDQAARHPGPIHLLITDVVMPEMNGRELIRRLREIRPETKCLFMSGYTANVIAHRGVLDEGVQFIPKPFSLPTLAAKVRAALEAPLA